MSTTLLYKVKLALPRLTFFRNLLHRVKQPKVFLIAFTLYQNQSPELKYNMAPPINRFIRKLQTPKKFLGQVLGVHSSKMRMMADNIAKAGDHGIRGIPGSAVLRAKRIAKVESGRTLNARVNLGATVATASTAGFLGLHKYHQHQDNKIMAKIDSMYKPK